MGSPGTNYGLRKVIPANELAESLSRAIGGVNQLVNFGVETYKGWISHEPNGAIVTATDPTTTQPDPVRAVKLPEFARLPTAIGGYTTGVVLPSATTFTLGNVHSLGPVYTTWEGGNATCTNQAGVAYAAGQYVVGLRDQASWNFYPVGMGSGASLLWAQIQSGTNDSAAASVNFVAKTSSDYKGTTIGATISGGLQTPTKAGNSKATALFSGDIVGYVVQGGVNVIVTDCYDDPMNTVRMIGDSNVPNGWTDITATLAGAFPFASITPNLAVTTGDTHTHTPHTSPVFSFAAGSLSGGSITTGSATNGAFTGGSFSDGSQGTTHTNFSVTTCVAGGTNSAITYLDPSTYSAPTWVAPTLAALTYVAPVYTGPTFTPPTASLTNLPLDNNHSTQGVLKPNYFQVRFIKRSS